MAPNKCVFMLERNTASFTCGLTRTLICYHGDDEMWNIYCQPLIDWNKSVNLLLNEIYALDTNQLFAWWSMSVVKKVNMEYL